MPIRFIDAYGQFGNLATVLDGLTGALVGDVTEPVIFTGTLVQRLDDLSGNLVGEHELISARSGAITTTFDDVSGLFTGSTAVPPLLPPASVGLEFL